MAVRNARSDLDAINEAGIPIVVLDYNAQTLDKHIKSTEIIELTGQEDRAAKWRKNTKTLLNISRLRFKMQN